MSEGLLGAVESIVQAVQKKFYGVAVGMVTDVNDLLGQGRVKVKLPWFNENEESTWVRIAQPVAGSGYGFYFIPEVDEEVLVAFEHGAIEHPYIIGRLWNLQEMPPEFSPLLRRSHIRTNAGHDIMFDDLLQAIEITTSTSQKITLDPLKIELTNQAGTVKIKLDNSAQSISIEAPLEIKLKAASIKLEGVNVDISGSAKAELKSSGICSVQGSLVKIN